MTLQGPLRNITYRLHSVSYQQEFIGLMKIESAEHLSRRRAAAGVWVTAGVALTLVPVVLAKLIEGPTPNVILLICSIASAAALIKGGVSWYGVMRRLNADSKVRAELTDELVTRNNTQSLVLGYIVMVCLAAAFLVLVRFVEVPVVWILVSLLVAGVGTQLVSFAWMERRGELG